MGFFTKLFGRGGTATLEREPDTATCVHTSLTARWDSVADMGKEERATGYRCQGCGQDFTPAEGRALRRSEADRVQTELMVDE